MNGVQLKSTENVASSNVDSEKVRVQFDIGKKSLANLDALVETFGAASRAEIIRRALYVLADVVEERANGKKFGFQDKNGNFGEVKYF